MALLVLGSFLGLAKGAFAGDLPRTASDLFQTSKVWTIHLRLTPAQWAAMEPAAGNNPFDGSMFGMGMFIKPAVMRDGDLDKNGSLSSEEFRGLSERWFSSWDVDGNGSLDSNQILEGLRRTMAPPSKPGERKRENSEIGFNLQGSKGKRNGLSAIMGIEFAQVHADLEFEGKTFHDVAVRYKGNGTFLESRGSLKRSIKIDLNKTVKGQKLAGVSTLNLHNNITDAGMMHEVMAFHLYREAGALAPRTAYARVFVTVPGKHDHKYFGLYSLVENVDKNFIEDRNLPKGAILKPSIPDLFTDLGDDWEQYEQMYDAKTELTKAQKSRIIEFATLVAGASDEEFAARLGDYLDLDAFARFMAVSVWIADLDGIMTTGQNYYLYFNSKTKKFQFIPWDKDHTFGSMGGRNQADRDELSILEPWEGRKRFLERVFKVKAFKDQYLARLAEFNNGCLRPESIEKTIAEIGAAIRPSVAEESPKKLTQFDAVLAGKSLSGGLFGLGAAVQTMRPFLKARSRSVAEQLAGKSEGRFLGKSKAGEPGKADFRPDEMLESAMMKALDTNRDKSLSRDEFVSGWARWFVAWDRNKSGNLSEDQVRKGLNKSLPFSFFPQPKKDDPKKPKEEGKAAEEKAAEPVKP